MTSRFDPENRTCHFVHASGPGAAAVRWLENRRDIYRKMLEKYFAEDRPAPRLPKPTVALLQQSTQMVKVHPGERGRRDLAVVLGPDDEENIKRGADVWEKLARKLHDDGIRWVIIGPHVYKFALEPQIHNERYALDELMSRGIPFILRGPNTWASTMLVWPEDFAKDGVHPDPRAAGLMCDEWARVIRAHSDSGAPSRAQK